MNYSINEMAELMGLSAETIRFYEKRGIISPSRNTSGYRSFSIEELSNLLDCKRYAGFGLSLQSIAAYFNGIDEEAFFALLRENDQARRQENHLRASISRHWEKALATLELMPLRGNDLYVKKYPEQTAVLVSAEGGVDAEDCNNLHALGRGNLNELLPLSDIKRVYITGPKAGRWEWAVTSLVFDKQDIGFLQLPKDVTLHEYPACYCFCRSVKIVDLEEIPRHIEATLAAIRAKGFQAGPQVFANSLIRVRLKDTFVRYTEIEVPVETGAGFPLTGQ